MTYTQMAAVAAAVVIAGWPIVSTLAAWFAARPQDSSVVPAYGKAMADLQSVRARLIRTGCLAQDQKNAIDVLTLALVDGSDK